MIISLRTVYPQNNRGKIIIESVIKTLREQNRYTQVKLQKNLVFHGRHSYKLPSPDIAEDEAMLKQLK